jgi:tRNA(Arg) A34 adenosine deaminase TadA
MEPSSASSVRNHRVEVVGGVREQESAALVRAFFADHRQGG